MKLNDITAGLLAVLLFCGTALAEVCPLRCELRRAVAVAQQTSGGEGMAMPGGHCHEMMGAAAKGMLSVGCAAVPCGHGEVPEVVADEAVRASLVGPGPAVMVDGVPVLPLQATGASWREAEGPPPMRLRFDPLMVALRV